MAHQMSPPQRPSQRPFSPYQQQPAHSPPGIALPPAKRPRLSPGIASPRLGSPQAQQSPFPESPYGTFSPSAGSPAPFNAPQRFSSTPPPGTMGPPPRPTAEQKAAKEKEEKEKVTDISDISDAMWGSGVDLREEENYLSSTNRSFFSTQSFTQSSSSQTTASPHTSFGQIKQELPGGQGPVSQEATTLESIQAEVERKHREAALKYAKQHEQHLRDPFLLGNSVRWKMHRIGVDQGVTLDTKGLYDPPKPQPPVTQQPQGVNGVVGQVQGDTALAAVKAKSVPEIQQAQLDETAKLANILSLVSLAANDRMRSLLDEAYTIAKGRQTGSQGIVPADFQDVATGTGQRETTVGKAESITNSPWDQPRPQSANSSDANKAISFTTTLPQHLSSIAHAEHAAEKARIKRRADRAAARAAEAAKAENAGTGAASTETSGAGDGDTPTAAAATAQAGTGDGAGGGDGPIDGAAPTTPGAGSSAKGLSKKERDKLAKSGQTEEVLHKNANVTAAMALGFGKKSKKRYSWMTGGVGGGGGGGGGASATAPAGAVVGSGGSGVSPGGLDVGTNPFAARAAAAKRNQRGANGDGEGGGGAGAGGKSGAGGASAGLGAERRFEGGRLVEVGGVTVRDWIAVLERDGRCGKGLERAYALLEKES